jgi:hypothetical protein
VPNRKKPGAQFAARFLRTQQKNRHLRGNVETANHLNLVSIARPWSRVPVS